MVSGRKCSAEAPLSCTQRMPLASGGTSSKSGDAPAARLPDSAKAAALPNRNRRRSIERERLIGSSIRIGFASLGDADLVVGESRVRTRQFELRHMAACAVRFRGGAYLFPAARRMARGTLRIVPGEVGLQ